MAEELGSGVNADGVTEGAQNLNTINALDLNGKGAPSLGNADERSLSDQGATKPDDVSGNANVVSANRTTFESMVRGGINQEPVVPTGDHVVRDQANPTARDNNVSAQFENVQPTFSRAAPIPEPAARPEPAAPAMLAPDQVVTRDPQAVPREEQGTQAPTPAAQPVAAAPAPQALPQIHAVPTPSTPDHLLPTKADPPALVAANASGTEDQLTKLNLSVVTADQDGGGEQISSITIGNVPDGFSFVDGNGNAVGTSQGNGVWSFTSSQLEDLYLHQPKDYSGDLQLTLSATSTDKGTTASSSTVFSVHIEAVADTPILAVHDAAGMEDSGIPLTISTATTDVDGSETAKVYITGVPDGAVLNHGAKLTEAVTLENGQTFAAGTWVLDRSQGHLTGLTITPPANDSADFTVQVYSASTEGQNGSTAISGPLDLKVDVGIVAPSVSGSGTGFEGQWTTLNLSGTVNHDLTGPQETLSVYIEGLPAGVSIRFADGSVPTATVVDGVTRYDVTGHLSDTQVQYANGDVYGAFDLTVRGVVHDTDVGTARETALGDPVAPDWNQSTATVHVAIAAQADAPTLTVNSAAGMEDTAILIGDKIHPTWTDNDGSENHVVYIENVPAGATLKSGATTFQALSQSVTLTHVDAGGTHTVVTIPAGSYVVTQAQLADLHITPPANDSADFTLKVVAASTETSNGDSAISGTALDLKVDVGIVAPSVSGSGAGFEGQWTTLNLSGTVNHDLAGPQETLSVYIEGLPAGVSIRFADGTAPTATVVDGVTRYDVTGHLSDTQVQYANGDVYGAFDLTVRGVVHDTDVGTARETALGDPVAPDWNQSTATVHVAIAAQADAPTLTVNSAAGMEDTAILIGDKIHPTWTDNDGSENHVVYIENVPAGSVLTTGSTTLQALAQGVTLTHVDAGGTHTVVTIPAGSYVVTQAQLADLHITPPANDSADFTLKVVAASTETSNGDSAISGTALDLKVDVGMVAPSVSGSGAGFEGQWTTLNLSGTINHDLAGPQETLSVYIEGLPVGVSIRFADGTAPTATVVDGVTRYDVTGHLSDTQVQYANGDSFGAFDLTVRGVVHDTDAGTARETALGDPVAPDWNQSTATVHVAVAAQADAPTLTVNSAAGMEDTAILIGDKIHPTWTDNDGSESHVVYIENVPAGSTLTSGGTTFQALSQGVTLTHVDAGGTHTVVTIPAGSYVVTQAQLADLHITPPANDSADFTLKVVAASTETSNGDSAISGTALDLPVDVGIVAPSAVANSAGGNEASWIKVDLTGTQINHDLPGTTGTGQETLTVTLENLPVGVQVGYGASGSQTLLATTSAGNTTITVPANHLSDMWVRWDQSSSSTVKYSDADISFKLHAFVKDGDVGTGRETPITDPTAPDSNQAYTDVTVRVDAVAQQPTYTATATAIGVEDKWVNLNLSPALQDTDGSESLTVTVSGLPSGLYLTQGDSTHPLVAVNGVYTFTAADNATMKGLLSDLRLYGLPANSNYQASGTDFTLTVKATSTEAGTNGGTVATSTAVNQVTVNAKVYGDADTPVVSVLHGATLADAVAINEDQFYNLSSTLRTISGEDGTSPTAIAATSADGSETLTLTLSADQTSRIWKDANLNGVQDAGEVTTLAKGATTTLSVADIAAGKIMVGGVQYWGNDTIHYQLTPKATENDSTDANASTDLSNSNSFDANSANDLSRNGSATGLTKDLYLHVNPVANATVIGASGAGLEDSAGIPLSATFRLTDTDGSESLTDNIQILVKAPMDGHLALNGVTLVAADANGDGQPDTVTVGGTTYTVYNIPVSNNTDYDSSTHTYTLKGLTYVPNANSDVDLTYRLQSYTHDNGATDNYVTTSGEGTLVVAAVADAPDISVGSTMALTHTSNTTTAATTVHVAEDGYLALNLKALPTDTDGSETLTSATLSNVPTGWSVVHWDASQHAYVAYAYDSTAKVWTLDPADLTNVYLHPPLNSDVDASMVVFSVTSTEAATGSQVSVKQATTTVAFNVAVDSVADTPTLTVSTARVLEDEKVKLDVRAAPTDTDGSETVSVTIGNANDGTFWHKEGASYVQYGNDHYDSATGTWHFSAGELSNIYFQPKANSNDDVALSVTAISTEAKNGSTTTNHATLDVVVTGVADPASVDGTVGGVNYVTAHGTEDQVINPHLEAHTSVDTDGSESLSVVLSNIPQGVTVFMDGTGNDGFLKYIGNNRWSVDPAHVQDIRLSAPGNYSGTFDMSVSLITTENDGDYKKVDATLRVTVDPVADAPTGGISGSGSEDGGSHTVDGGTTVSFSVSASVADTGGGNSAIGAGGVESVYAISNVKLDVDDMVAAVKAAGGHDSDVYVTFGGQNYLASADANNHYYITIPSVAVPTGQTTVSIPGFVLHGVPGDYSTDVHVHMEVQSKDGTDISATAGVDGTLKIYAVADQPVFSVADDTDLTPSVHDAVTTGSTHTVTLDGIGLNPLVNTGDTSETLYVVVGGVPNGVKVVGGYNNGDGTWTLPGGTKVDDIQLVASSHASHLGENLTVTITANVTDVDPDGDRDTTSGSTSVTVNLGTFDGGGSGGTLPAIPKGSITGSLTATEDTSFSLGGMKSHITVVNDQGTADTGDDVTLSVGANGTCSDGSQVSLVVQVPTGWTISGSGFYLLETGSGSKTYTVPYGALDNVTLTPPKDFSGDTSTLKMRVVVTADDGRYDTQAADYTTVPVQVAAVADQPTITVTAAQGSEDGGASAISLTLKAGDTDYSEAIGNQIIIKVFDQSGASPGKLTASGTEDATTHAISVDIDNDNQVDYVLSAGVAKSGYTEYTVTLTDVSAFKTAGGLTIPGLGFIPAHDFSGSVHLSTSVAVTDTAYDSANAVINTSTLNSTKDFTISVASQVDHSTFVQAGAPATNEDTAVALNVAFTHSDVIRAGTQWASETMSVVISNVPAGATLTGAYNNGDGTWTVYDTNLAYQNGQWVLQNVKFVPAPDDSSDVTLSIDTYAKEADGTAWVKESSQPFTVVVQSVADGGTIIPQAVSGTEDHLVALNLGAQVHDLSESAIITIGGVPSGAYLTDGAVVNGVLNKVGTYVAQADGTWTVTLDQNQVSALGLLGSGKIYFTAAQNVSGTWTMTAKIASVDADADTYDPVHGTYGHTSISTETGPFNFTVTLAAVADLPTLTVAGTTVTTPEDNAVQLNLGAVLNDTDGSEALSLTISGAPSQSVFTVTYADGTTDSKTAGADGIVTLGKGSLAITGVQMTPPANYDSPAGGTQLTVTATATEASNADAASVSQTITVNVTPVDDAPVLSGVVGQSINAGTINAAQPLTTASNITISDVENDQISSMSLSISGAKAGDALGLTGLNPVRNANGDLVVTVNGKDFVVDYHAGVLKFSSTTAGYSDYTTLLANKVIFSSTTGSLSAGTRNVTVSVTDAGGATSTAFNIPVNVVGAATLSGAALGTAIFSSTGNLSLATEAAPTTAEDNGPIALNLHINQAVASDMTVTITGEPTGTVFHTLTGDVVAGASGVTLTAAQMSNLSIEAPHDWNGSATLMVTASDAGMTMTEKASLVVTAVNDAPTATMDGATTQTQGAAGAAITAPIHVIPDGTGTGSHVHIADVDGTQLSALKVQIASGVSLGDTLGLSGHDIALDASGHLVVAGTSIQVAYDANSHTLSFSGTGSYSTYAQLAESVVLSNSTGTMSAGTRAFTVTMYDEQGAASQPLSTSAVVSDASHGAVPITSDAQGQVYWDASSGSAVLNGGSAADTLYLHAGVSYGAINGNGGIDSLLIETGTGQHGDWLFQLQADGLVHATSAGDPSHSGIIHLDTGSPTATVDTAHNQVVFNGSANGTLDFSDGTHVVFHGIEKIGAA